MTEPVSQPVRFFPRIVLAVLALFLVYQATIALRHALSDIYARPAIKFLEDKRFSNFELSLEEWEAIAGTVRKAAWLMPDNPHYLQNLGWLHQIRLYDHNNELDIDGLDRQARLADEYYRMATRVRPTWPYYWGNLAIEKYRRGQYGSAAYSRALSNAARFGPWKDDTQRLVAELGADTWGYLKEDARWELLATINRGLRRQPERIGPIVESYGAWGPICMVVSQTVGISDELARLEEYCVQHLSGVSDITGQGWYLDP